MFNKSIYSTMLTSEVADHLFANITATDTPDSSFLATMRALLRQRLPQNESVRLSCHRINCSAQDMDAATASTCMSWFVPELVRYAATSSHCIFIIYAPFPGAGEKMLEIVRANAGAGKRYMGTYTRRDDLQVFYARKAKALFYTDDTGKNTVIFAEKLELKHFHVLQMMIPKYLPLLFKDNPLNEDEVLLLKSTANKSAIAYETLLAQVAKAFDIRTEVIRSKLAGFETVFERQRADELRNELAGYQRDYDSYLARLRDIANKIQTGHHLLAGLVCAINERREDSELMQYFMCNKNLSIVQVQDTAIELITHGYADIYDEDAFEQYVGNHDGFMYSHLSPAVTKPQMEMLYRAIFSQGIYKLRLCAAYNADMRKGLRALQHYSFPSESMSYLPNPHIQQYGCMGTYGGYFQEYTHRGDYVGAIEQAAVSGRNLNFYDSPVMQKFAETLSRTTFTCIEKPDGTLLTPLEAINELEGGTSCPGPSS